MKGLRIADCGLRIDRMIRRLGPYVILPLLLVAGLVWVLAGREPRRLGASLVAAAAPGGASGFARADGRRPLTFPQDHGPHDDFRTEWWYTTGNLTAGTGERFGYQLTFFRRALLPPEERRSRPSAWAAEQVYMAHFALTDVAGGEHRAFEKLGRGSAGLAGAQAAPYRVWLDNWSVEEVAGGLAGFPARLRASAEDISLDLTLRDLKGPVLQGDGGYSRKGPEPGNASTYYSLPRIATAGTVTVGGQTFSVDGLSWMDHEFSTSALGADQAGWDWFSLQLDNDYELMVFQLRRADGTVDRYSSGTLIAPDGTTQTLGPDDFTLERAGQWRSARTGATYPSGWVLTIPAADLRLTITPLLADQEMNVSYAYWEGAVDAEGTMAGKPVSGSGYVELTGYAGSMQGQF
jgi:predicted secreted hydrolase